MAGGNKTFEQDFYLDVDGKKIFDVMTVLDRRIDNVRAAIEGLGQGSVKSANDYKLAMETNLKLLRQASGDFAALQKEQQTRIAGFKAGNKELASTAKAELNADRQARQQGLIESKVYYGERAKAKKDEDKKAIEAERAGNKLVSDANVAEDRRQIQSAKEVAKARREAGQAGVSKAVGAITDPNSAREAKAASDMRLAALRREREEAARTNLSAIEGITARVNAERTLNRELDARARVLDRQRASADSKFAGLQTSGAKMLAPSDVASKAQELGSAAAAKLFYQTEQDAARRRFELTLANRNATITEGLEAKRNLEIANQRVTAAQRLVNEENKVAAAEAKQAAAQGGGAKNTLKNVLTPGYAANAVARTAVYGAAAGVAYGAFSAVQGGITETIQLEDEFQKLQAIANATDVQMQTLKTSIFEIASTSRFATVDLAKISQTLAQAGVSAGSMKEVLGAVTGLATASGSTPDEAVNLVTSALGSFQLQASESARIADLMTTALNRTKLTVGQVGQAIQYVGATAFEQNIGLEQLLATVGAIAQAGVRSGSTIGTGMRQFLVDLQTPSEKLTKQLDAVGLKANDVNVAVKGLPAVLNALRDAGFGSAQAYQGLETRAAAFYLVAKNNVDVMNELQMSFAAQGAAALAQERAMNSLTAQWQRFKNILLEDFADGLETPMAILQDLLKKLSDRQLEMRAAEKGLRDAADKGDLLGGYQKQYGEYQGAAMYSVNTSGTEALRQANEDIKNILNGFGLSGLLGIEGMGDQWEAYAAKVGGASDATKDLTTDIADQAEKVEAQAGLISEVDKETARLITQQDSLKGQTVAVTTETISLSSRFEGLAAYLTNATNKYGDLMNAMRLYRNEAAATQIANLVGQRALYDQQAGAAKVNATSLANQALADPSLRGDPRLQAALRTPRLTGNTAYIGDAANKTGNPILLQLSRELGGLAVATSQSRLATSQLNNTVAENTKAGQSLRERAQRGEAGLPELNSLTGAPRAAKAAEMRTEANAGLAEAKARLANPETAKDARPTLMALVSRFDSTLKGISAALAPDKSEIKAAKAAETEAKKRERAAAQRPAMTQSDIDNLGAGLGVGLGSGVRTKAEQNRLHAMGVTTATGETSSHSNGGFARDFSVRGMTDAQAEAAATAIRARAKQRGLEVYVKFERGGANDGTGRHIHTSARRGARRGRDGEAVSQDQYAEKAADAQVKLDEEDLKTKLKAISLATTKEAFDGATTAAREALDRVNDNVRTAADLELAGQGLGPDSPLYKQKMAQVEQTIAQNVEDYQLKITESIIKSTDRLLAAAQTAFDTAMAPSERTLAIAQAQASGFETYANRNRVPEYVKTLAAGRVGEATDARDQAQLGATNTQLEAGQAARASLIDQLDDPDGNVELLNQKIKDLDASLLGLTTTRDALAAKLDVEGFLPHSVGDSVNGAIKAYEQLHELNRSFDDTIIMGMGDAVTSAADSITNSLSGMANGTQSVLGGFQSMAKGIMASMKQMAAQYVANQAIMAVFKLVSSIAGSAAGAHFSGGIGGADASSDMLNASGGFHFDSSGLNLGSFNGGPAFPVEGLRKGGRVTNGSPMADTVDKRLARDEWVIQKSAVDSVGHGFMADLNANGAGALKPQQVIQPIVAPRQETSVYIVPPTSKPTLGKNDVLVAMQEDMLNGESRKLIKYIAQGG